MEVGTRSRPRDRQRGACPDWPRTRRKSEWEPTQTSVKTYAYIVMDIPGKRQTGQVKYIMCLCTEHAHSYATLIN